MVSRVLFRMDERQNGVGQYQSTDGHRVQLMRCCEGSGPNEMHVAAAESVTR
jgi:hypothetical protein